MSLLDRLAAEVEGRDPGNLCQPLKRREAPSYCYCPADVQEARLALSQRLVICGRCRREIEPSCKRRQVVWLRSLLKLSPEHFDAESIADLII